MDTIFVVSYKYDDVNDQAFFSSLENADDQVEAIVKHISETADVDIGSWNYEDCSSADQFWILTNPQLEGVEIWIEQRTIDKPIEL